MKPTKTPHTEVNFELEGGTPENDLPATVYDADRGGPCFGSTWVPTDDERTQIALGANIELIVWGTRHPPVAIRLADYKVEGYRPPYNIQFPTPKEDNQDGMDDPATT